MKKYLKRFKRKLKYNRKANNIIWFVFIAFLFMGVGYAYLNATLTINGTGKVTKTVWDVHFENVQPINGSVTPTSAPVISNDTTVSFSATLNEPGDFYSFDVDVVNAGTLDATISAIDISPTLTTEQQEYFEYSIKYKGDNSLDVQEGDALSHGDTKTIEILFRYKELDNDDLYPDEDVSFDFEVTINYIQGSYNKEDSVMKTSYWGDESAFRAEDYRTKIVKVILDDHLDPPASFVKSWDISQGNNGNVMAYLIFNSEDNTKYDLYIQGNGHLYAPEDSKYLFAELEALEIINLNVLDTSNVTNMQYMFSDTSNVEYLDVSGFDTSNVTDMLGMFSTLDEYPIRLRHIIGLENFNTSKVTNMAHMFYYQTKLEFLNLSSFDTSKVTNMSMMFGDCKTIESLDLQNFNTSKVTNMSNMFGACSSLTELDLSGFNTSLVTDMSFMFAISRNLRTIKVSNNFVTDNVTSSNSMFYDCIALVGGNGTVYTSSQTNKTYARIDAVGTPGYFTQG